MKISDIIITKTSTSSIAKGNSAADAVEVEDAAVTEGDEADNPASSQLSESYEFKDTVSTFKV